MTARTIDHVALWVADRDAIAERLIADLGMHTIERTDRFTLLGADARRFKLTLFDEEGPRVQGALKQVTLRVNEGEEASHDVGEGLTVNVVPAETEVDYDLDHVALFSADPEATAREYLALGFNEAEPRDGVPRVELGGAYLEFHPGDPSAPERPLLNHLAVLVDRADDAKELPAEVADVVDAPNTYAVFVWGPERVKIEYVEHKPTFSLVQLTAIAGAGMAGLVAAARARQLGVDVTVYEKGDRVGGSMLLSSGVVWRHLRFEDFRIDCPRGDERLQRLIWERLDESLEWLESTTGVRPLRDDTDNPGTTGRRYDPAELTVALSREAGEIRFGQPFRSADRLVLATGGFPVRVARERGLLVRSNPWSEGDGLDHARSLGAATAADLDELYARAMPAPPARISESDYVRLSQLYGGRARVTNERGEEFFPQPPAWHENDLAQAIARQPGGTAWFELDDPSDPKVQAARDAGGEVVEEDGRVRVHVAAGVTHTLGGLRVDERARVLREDGTPIEGLLAAGVDVGGIASGGYASGLAQALVLGLVAAETLAS